MSDFILIDGDNALFQPNFGPAVVVVQPGTLRGSGVATCRDKPLCVAGDEASVQVAGCAYISANFSVPGSGTLKIEALAGDQLAKKAGNNGKPLLLKGSRFTAIFEVQSPATDPGSGASDPMTRYGGGSGQFITTNTQYRGA